MEKNQIAEVKVSANQKGMKELDLRDLEITDIKALAQYLYAQSNYKSLLMEQQRLVIEELMDTVKQSNALINNMVEYTNHIQEEKEKEEK